VVSITTVATGTSANYPLATSSSTSQGQYFGGPSFTASASGASLTGGTNGTAVVYSLNLGYTGNGNVLSANDSVNGNWAYTYDDMNRLLTSNKNSGQLTFSYDYDRYGNRWHQNAPQGGPAPQFSVSAYNRLDGYTYDAAGNVYQDGAHTYYYLNNALWRASAEL
jgi:YD repeat-containing protein